MELPTDKMSKREIIVALDRLDRQYQAASKLARLGVELAEKTVKLATSLDSNEHCVMCGGHVPDKDHLEDCPYWKAREILKVKEG